MGTAVMRCAVIVASFVLGCAAAPRGVQWSEADALFHQEPRWLGADSAYSIPLDGDRIVWLFGDTFVATSKALTRREAAIVRNSIAVQYGADPLTATMHFYWRGTDATPQSFFGEPDAQHWYWPAHGVAIDGTLVIFMERVSRTPDNTLGFVADGWVALIIDDTRSDPLQWTARAVAPGYAPKGLVPSAVARDGDSIVVLAQREPGDHAGFVVRWSRQDLKRGLLDNGIWSAQVMADAGPESSLHLDAHAWRHVSTSGVGSARIVMASASRPEGPWSAAVTVFEPPEIKRKGVWIYAAKAHPELATPDGAVAITYNINYALDFGALVSDPTVYYPRFVRAKSLGPFR